MLFCKGLSIFRHLQRLHILVWKGELGLKSQWVKLERNNPVLSFWELPSCSPGDLILFPVGNENTPLVQQASISKYKLDF